MTVTVSGSSVVFNDSTTQTTAFTGTATTATTATNLAGGAQGSIPYQSASGTTALLAAGTSGKVLTTQGSGANPTWTTPSTGAMTLISTQTVSGSTTITWSSLSGYGNYLLILTGLNFSGAKMYIQLGTGSSPTWITSGYYYGGTGWNSFNGAWQTGYGGDSGYDMGCNYVYGQGFGYSAGQCYIEGALLTSSSDYRGFSSQLYANATRQTVVAMAGNITGITGAITAIQLNASTGSFTGSVSLYGITT